MKIFLSLIASAVVASAVHAQDSSPMQWQQSVMNVGNGFKVALMGEGGDIANFLRGSNCSGRAKEGEARGTRLARYYRELVDSVVAGDAEKIYAHSVRLNTWIKKSNMFQRCWNTILNQSNGARAAGNMVQQVLSIGPKPSSPTQ